MKTIFEWSDEQFETFVECYKRYINNDTPSSEKETSKKRIIEILSSIYVGKVVKYISDDDLGTRVHLFKISELAVDDYLWTNCYGIDIAVASAYDASFIQVGYNDFYIFIDDIADKDNIIRGTNNTIAASEEEFNQELQKCMDRLQNMLKK